MLADLMYILYFIQSLKYAHWQIQWPHPNHYLCICRHLSFYLVSHQLSTVIFW